MSRAFAPTSRARLLAGIAAASVSVGGLAFAAASGAAGAFSPVPSVAAPGDTTPDDDSGPEHADVVGNPGVVSPPDGLGNDEAMNALAVECYDGGLLSCDLLFLRSPVASAYESYGDTCAGRQAAGGERYCLLGRDDGGPSGPNGPDSPASVEVATTEPTPSSEAPTSEPGDLPEPTLEPTGLGDDAELDALAQACYDGDLEQCDTLYARAEPDSDYRHFGDTCAGRQPELTGRLCVVAFPDAEPPVGSELPPATSESAESLPPLPDPPLSTVPATGGSIPPATQEPVGLGTDASLDALAQACYDGDMESCDELWRQSEEGSDYREYGDTCAGRQPSGTGRWCTTTFPGDESPDTTMIDTVPPSTAVPPTTVAGAVPPPTLEPVGLGDDPALDALAQACYDGSLESCDELWRQSDTGSDYRSYGDTCAGRQEPDTGRWCVDAFGESSTVPPTTVFVPPPPSTTIAPGGTVPGSTAPGGTIATGIPPATQEPIGLGTDPALDALARECYAGDMVACDSLFDAAPMKSAYQAYGDTCAGRQPTGTFKYCRAAFPAASTAP